MRMLGWNLALALTWSALRGQLTVGDLVVGLVLGFIVLGWLVPSSAARGYVRRLPRVVTFLFAYAYDVVISSLRIAWEVITPWPRRRPGIIEVPLDLDTPTEIAVLANLVTFTPGTVAIDLDEGRRTMIVHDMFIDDPETSRRRIKDRYERWVLRLLR